MKPNLAPLPRESLPDAIANAVARAIASRALPAGARVIETSLAAELGVSRVPVREALKILHTQGIVDGGGHRGYRVAPFSPTMVAHVQEARMELETLFLSHAIVAWRGDPASLEALDAAIEPMRQAAQLGQFSEMLQADVAFHTAICLAAGKPLYMTLWNAISRHVLIILNLARFRDVDLGVVVRRHEALRDQIRRAVSEADAAIDARRILEDHFLAEREARALHDPSGAPKPAPRRPRKTDAKMVDHR